MTEVLVACNTELKRCLQVLSNPLLRRQNTREVQNAAEEIVACHTHVCMNMVHCQSGLHPDLAGTGAGAL